MNYHGALAIVLTARQLSLAKTPVNYHCWGHVIADIAYIHYESFVTKGVVTGV